MDEYLVSQTTKGFGSIYAFGCTSKMITNTYLIHSGSQMLTERKRKDFLNLKKKHVFKYF